MSKPLPAVFVAFLYLLLGVSAGNAQRGALTLPRNLDQLTQQSALVVDGTVLSARVERHPQLTNLYTVVVTMRVSETLKGKAGATLTFRQFIWDIRDRYDAAGYRKGQRLLLLLNGETSYGLQSPAGLEQGRFLISQDRGGKPMATNGRNNQGLFRSTEQSLGARGVKLPDRLLTLARQHQRGAVALDDLKQFVRLAATQ